MGIGKRAPNPRAARAKQLKRGGTMSAREAQQAAQESAQPRTSLFAQRKAAAAKKTPTRGGRS